MTTVVLLMGFLTRVVLAQGWYIVTYALGIYLLNLFLAFLQPKYDPAQSVNNDGQEADDEDDMLPALPTKDDEEFRPFIRR